MKSTSAKKQTKKKNGKITSPKDESVLLLVNQYKVIISETIYTEKSQIDIICCTDIFGFNNKRKKSQ